MTTTQVLEEFVTDVEAAGVDHLQEEWPDLFNTYHHAKRALRETTVTVHVTTEQVATLLCSAFEGGSNYWYLIETFEAPKNYDRYRSTAPGDRPIRHIDYPLNEGGSLKITTLEGDVIADRTQWILDHDACMNGLNVMAKKYPKHFADLLNENDDAITGDVFLQCCLFGEVIFG